MKFVFLFHDANGQRLGKPREVEGSLEQLKESCNAAIGWEAKFPGCKALVFSVGNFKTCSVSEAPDKLALVLGIRDRKAAQQAAAAATEAVEVPF